LLPTSLGSAQVAAHFQRGSVKKIQPLLDTLAAMFLVRQVEGERAYAG